MSRRFARVLAVALVLVLVTSQTSQAAWYAGNKRISGYGVKAQIGTPTGEPAIYGGSGSGESSWVSATHYVSETDYSWVQTGWLFYPNDGVSRAQQYEEALVGGWYSGIIKYAYQQWSTSIEYRVEYVGNSNWKVYVAGSGKDTFGPLPAPTEMQALLEVQGSSDNQASTPFLNVSYQSSQGSGWTLFDQANWVETYPYRPSRTATYQWNSYRQP
ncbi:MAG TPA: hypothetical protein PLG21_18695 [Anaerolineae bacterium]|nr:hypothetical protein [Anaerolineae bacterium]